MNLVPLSPNFSIRLSIYSPLQFIKRHFDICSTHTYIDTCVHSLHGIFLYLDSSEFLFSTSTRAISGFSRAKKMMEDVKENEQVEERVFYMKKAFNKTDFRSIVLYSIGETR